MSQMMTRAQYATHIGKSDRTVQRYLADGLLPGAQLAADGTWRIPADVLPLLDDPAPRSVVATSRATDPPVAPPATLAGALDVLPAYLTIEAAARLLGISAYAVRTHIARYCGERVGEGGAWMVPAAVVRQVAGL